MSLADRLNAGTPRVTVHEIHRPPAPVLRYIDQVAGSQSEIDFRYSRGVLTRFDVDVVHVADSAVDSLLGTRGVGGYQRLLSTLALTRNLRRHRIGLVRTIHRSDKPPSSLRADVLARRLLDRATSKFIILDDSTPTPDSARTVVIAHAHYRDRFIGYPRSALTPGRVLCFNPRYLPDSARGVLGIDRIAHTPEVTLRLAGMLSPELEPYVRAALARHSSTVSARIELLSDSAQVQEISAAELVAIPRVESYEQEQLVFLALSLDRPVIVPRNVAMIKLAHAVGPGWIHLLDGPLTANSVDDAFASLRRDRLTASPNLEGRELTTVHAAYEHVFTAVELSLRAQDETMFHPMNERAQPGKHLQGRST